jgi:hypothetical protein
MSQVEYNVFEDKYSLEMLEKLETNKPSVSINVGDEFAALKNLGILSVYCMQNLSFIVYFEFLNTITYRYIEV